jgi:succinate dehydrogenase / fumarate reductase, iron-sulfur subunit
VTAVETAPGLAESGETEELINLTLFVWRQAGPDQAGSMVKYDAPGISTHMSFLEMLDVVNERLTKSGGEPIAFDHDCREGICGTCGLMINGIAHGPERATTTCQLHMRHFSDGATVYIEPWRAHPFPVIKDLIVDRGAFDRIIEAGGYITAATGGAPEANGLPVPKPDADTAFDAAACIGCGACVAACKNASAMLFVSAKVSHLNILPQGQPEKDRRVLAMVTQMDEEGFGACTVTGSCEAVCPKGISLNFIAKMNRDYLGALLRTGGKQAASAES